MQYMISYAGGKKKARDGLPPAGLVVANLDLKKNDVNRYIFDSKPEAMATKNMLMGAFPNVVYNLLLVLED